MKKYKYYVITSEELKSNYYYRNGNYDVDYPSTYRSLDDFGDNGWQLVSVCPNYHHDEITYYFMKEICVSNI